MPISDEILKNISIRSLTIFERRELGLKAKKNSEKKQNEMLLKWKNTIAEDNEVIFERRLKLQNLSIDSIKEVLAEVEVPEKYILPDWCDILQIYLNEIKNNYNLKPSYIKKEKVLPFEELFYPLINIAKQKLEDNCKEKISHLKQNAINDLIKQLLQELTKISSKTLFAYFKKYRYKKNPASMFTGFGKKTTPAPTKMYNEFISELKNSGIIKFLQEYPVLARAISTVTIYWIKNSTTFITNLNNDISKIEDTFNNSKKLGKIKSIKAGLSDPHNSGKSVFAITFESNLKVVYKPKEMILEYEYYKFINWLNLKSSLDLKVLKVIDCKDYGWVEFVETKPLRNQHEAKNYYIRAGMLLGINYILRGTDAHCENIIACGDQPVMIDLEALMHHDATTPQDESEANAQSSINEKLIHSVFRTGMLPQWTKTASGTTYDISGLGSVIKESELSYKKPCFEDINNDYMNLVNKEIKSKIVRDNIPKLDNKHLCSYDYKDDVIEGFDKLYNLCIKYKEELLKKDGSLSKIANQKVRFIFRATKVYGYILDKINSPDILCDGVNWSIKMDDLSRAFIHVDNEHPTGKILALELKAMTNFDIPFFLAHASSSDFYHENKVYIKNCFKKASFDYVKDTLNTINESDLKLQKQFINASIHATTATNKQKPLFMEDINIDNLKPLDTKKAVFEATKIADKICENTIIADDGSVTWLQLNVDPTSEKFYLGSMPPSLYDGHCGVALFLAQISFISKNAKYKDISKSALKSLCIALDKNQPDRELSKYIGIGGAAGLGSIIYCLTKTAKLLNEPSYLEYALKASKLITDESISSDKALDVISGSAGAILGLLNLYEETNNPMILDTANKCAKHILSQQKKSETGHMVWETITEDKFLAGFSHGAAGISYALQRLYFITKNDDYLNAAKQALDYETAIFSKEHPNWPDNRLSNNSNKYVMNAWCHGAIGIGLGRMAGLDIYDNEQSRLDINYALDKNKTINLTGPDHMCCGNGGAMELFLSGAEILKQPELKLRAAKIATFMIDRKNTNSEYSMSSYIPDGLLSPGFFQGLSGIGHVLLRVAHSDKIPAVLLWK